MNKSKTKFETIPISVELFMEDTARILNTFPVEHVEYDKIKLQLVNVENPVRLVER